MSRLPRSFFARDAVTVARALIGARLFVRGPDGHPTGGIITECEAYRQDDTASHSRRGLTARNAAMFGPPGHAYVYFIYGMHFCLNVVTGAPGVGEAVLLRALRPTHGLAVMRARRGNRVADASLCDGPGKLCQALGIDRALNGIDLCARAAPLRVHAALDGLHHTATPRIGISGDAVARSALWRFVATDPAPRYDGAR